MNKDGIISSEYTTKLMTNTLENSVTTGDAVQLKDGQERVKIWFERTGKITNKKVHATVDYVRELKTGTLAHESGQPSIIEGQNVIITAPNIVTSSITEANGQTNVGTIENNTKKVFGKQVNKGTIETNGKVEIIGNNQNLEKIKETGTIEISPTLVSSMFRENEEPTSKYLMETRSKYVQLNNFYGSDYFLTRVGYEDRWDRVRRLGDAYYESQLITKALTERLGSQFINGKSGQDLMKQLMDNALVEKNRQNLKIGIALTQEQRKNLGNDIIWYVYKDVNGVRVLAPEIYLTNHTVAEINNDTRNRIGGFEKTYVTTNNLENIGTKIGNKGTTIVDVNSLKNITKTNLVSEIAGDDVQITAINDIENIGGKISGTDSVNLVSKQGNIVNETTKRTVKYYKDELDRTEHEEIASTGEISSKGTINIAGNNVISKGAIISGQNVVINAKNDVKLQEITLTGEDKFGSDGDNFKRFKKVENKESNLIAENLVIKGENLNVSSSNVMVENAVIDTQKVEITAKNDVIETESRSKQKGFMKKLSSEIESHDEINKAGTLLVKNQAIITGDLNAKGSNVVLGENSFVGGKLTTDSNELNNTYYHEEKKSGFSGSISSKGVSIGYGKSQSIYAEKGKTNAKSTLHLGDGTVLNKGAEITATDFTHGQVTVNNGDVKFGARVDTKDVKMTNKSSHFGVSVGVNSPVLDRAKQLENATKQIQNGDVLGGGVEVVNAITGTIKGLADNQGKQNAGTKEAFANNNFYANIGVNAGFTKAKSEINSHTESAVTTNITGIDENSSIIYNNLKNVEYIGTKAENTTFVYNNVENVNKKAVELHNNFSSNSSSKGINAGVTIGYSNKVQTIGNEINVSANKSNQNTNEIIYKNGSFVNINEIHNNTKNMTLDGFNQEGGKVVGNIEKLEIILKQNTSATSGSSKGVGVGFNANGVPSSVNLSGSVTNGNRAFVDNQSSFSVGENSNLKIKNVTNEAGIIGANGQNSNIKIENYVGKDIENYDKMETTGGSVGISTGKQKVTNFGVNQEIKDKQGITRNTVIGNVEIEKSSGDTINTDLNKANEITKDNQNSMNVNVESQTLEYVTNPSKFKEDIEKAKAEIADIFTASKESIHDRGDDNRNFFGQLGEVRLSKTINNIAGEKLEKTDNSEEIARTFEDTYADLGYKNTKVIFTTPENTPQLKDEKGNPKAGTAYVDKETGKRTILINVNDKKNHTKAGLIGTIAEEGSHVINALENRKVETGTDEKGLESTGRATNEYFKNLYSKNDKKITLKSDGEDYSNVDFGENVGDDIGLFHGGGPGNWRGVEGLKQILDFSEENIYRLRKIDHDGDLDWLGIRVHNKPNIAAKTISDFEHKTKDLKIDIGYSMSADGLFQAAGKNEIEKTNELIAIYARVRYIEQNLPNITKESTDKIYVVNLTKDDTLLAGMGFRSYEKTQKAVKKMISKGELIPKDTNIYVNRHGVEVVFIKMEKGKDGSHGGVMKVGSPYLPTLINRLKEAGSQLPIKEGAIK